MAAASGIDCELIVRRGRVVVLAESDADLDSALDIACPKARLQDAGVCVLMPPSVDPAVTEAIKSRLAGLRARRVRTGRACFHHCEPGPDQDHSPPVVSPHLSGNP